MRHLSFILFFFPQLLIAQADSLKSLPVFSIVDSIKNPKEVGFSVIIENEDMMPRLNQNLAEILQNQSGISIKSYGPGQLATPTFRGGDANQTIVLWNGAKLNSPALGSIDFTLIPVDLFQNVSLVTSSATNLYNVGGIGGGVLLNSAPVIDDFELKLGLSAGSFGQEQFQFKLNLPISFIKGKFAVLIQNSESKADNEFSYLDIYNEPYKWKVRKQAFFEMKNRQVGFTYKLEKFDFTVITWETNAKREIPQPINIEETFNQFQDDTSLRIQLTSNYNPSKNQSFKLMAFREVSVNRYQDTIAKIDNPNKFRNDQGQIDWAMKFKKASFLSSINQVNFNYTEASSQNFVDQKTQLGIGSFHQLKFEILKKKIRVIPGFRTLFQDDQGLILPFTSLNVKPSKIKLPEIYANASRSARFPTLNELYWNPGGNASLKPESATNFQVGGKSRNWRKLSVELAVFYSLAQNRIRWMPNGATFSPMNVAESRTLGTDFKLDWFVHSGRNSLIKATFIQSITNSFGKLEAQDDWQHLSYIPQLKSSILIKADYKNLTTFLNYSYLSKRFITNDESAYMPDFSILNFGTKYYYRKFTLSTSIDNLLNTNYQVLAWRPMPGRSFNFSVVFSL